MKNLYNGDKECNMSEYDIHIKLADRLAERRWAERLGIPILFMGGKYIGVCNSLGIKVDP